MSIDSFFVQQLIFICTTCALLLIPGWFFLSACFARNQFALLEKFILSVPTSFALLTLTIILADRFHLLLDKNTLLMIIAAIVLPFAIITFFTKKTSTHTHIDIFTFTKKQYTLLGVIIIFTILAKSLFLINSIFPTATDLAHHLYWVKKITIEHHLPTYKEIEITDDADGLYLSEPHAIPDFIIGEHVFISTVAILTDVPIISAFTSLILFVINIFTMLMIFVLTRRLFYDHRFGSQIALLTLLFIGPLWTIGGAQAKFVSGGVIGNLIGNLLIPATIYFLYRALSEKRSAFMIPAIILATTLAYTHHLSAFIFGYVFVFSIILFMIFQIDGWVAYKKIFSLFKNPFIIPLLIGACAMILFLAPPSYLDRDVIASSVGTPSKSTRIGIPFFQLQSMLGDARFIFGFIGVVIFFITISIFRLKNSFTILHTHIFLDPFAIAFLGGWPSAILLMSLSPHLLHVNILSSRIATYAAFPLSIFAAFFIMWTIDHIKDRNSSSLALPQFILSFFILCILTYTFTTGLRDNATSMNTRPETNTALQTFHAGDYTSKVFKKNIQQNDFWILKDHNYITADTWLKIFFAYDFSYPLSRGYFARYESNPDRETCTFDMISTPHSERSMQCYESLNVKAVLVSTEQDAPQFTRSENFYRIYQNNELSLFLRK